MPVVTDIKTQIKNPDKVSVYIDGKYNFSLTVSQLADYKTVRVNKEITDSLLSDLKKLSRFTAQYLQVISLVYARPRSEYEIRTKLRQKKLDSEEIDALVNKLKEDKYLNDKDFAVWWVNGRKNTRSTSTLKLKAELAQKGINSSLATEVIEENFNKEDEENSLRELLNKKRGKYDSEQKLMSYLASKGFKYSQIKEILEETNN